MNFGRNVFLAGTPFCLPVVLVLALGQPREKLPFGRNVQLFLGELVGARYGVPSSYITFQRSNNWGSWIQFAGSEYRILEKKIKN